MVLGLAGPLACGPSPEAVAPVQPKPVEPTPRQAAAPVYDLSPVQEPADIVAMTRWKNPAVTLSSIASCSGMPSDQLDAGGKLLADLILREMLGDAANASELAQAIALDAPIDFVAAMDPSPQPREPFMVVSVGLTSLERARGAIEGGSSLTEVGPGMWRVGTEESTDVSCAIAASAGAAPARLICGPRDKDVKALGPYLARNVPTMATAGADVHGELRFTPVSTRYGRELQQQLKFLPIGAQSQLSIGEPRFDRAIVEMATALQDELTALVGELDRVTVDLGVDQATCLKASGALELRGKASWTAGSMVEAASLAGAPPALFWRLPKDSTVAYFRRTSDPARYTSILQTLRSLLEGALTKWNVGTAADRKALVQLIAMPLGKNTSAVQASGQMSAPAAKPGAKAPKSQAAAEDLMNGILGWNLVGVDEGPAALTKSMKDFVAAYTRQLALAVTYEKAAKRDDAKLRAEQARGKLPSPTELEAREKQRGPRSVLTPLVDDTDMEAKMLPTLKLVKAPATLGKDALDVEIKISDIPSPENELGPPPDPDKRAAKKGETLTFTLHLLLMPDDNTTWIAFGMNRDELVKRLLGVKSGAPDTATLASRPGLEPLKNGKLVSGGFVTLLPLTKAVGAGVSFANTLAQGGLPAEVQQIMSLVNTMPHRGESPIFFTTEATANAAPRSEMSFSMPKAVMEDLGWLVMGGMNMAMRARP